MRSYDVPGKVIPTCLQLIFRSGHTFPIMWTCVLELGHFWAETLTCPRGTACEDIAPTVLVFWQANDQNEKLKEKSNGCQIQGGKGGTVRFFLAGKWSKEKLQEKSNGWQIQDGKGGTVRVFSQAKG